MKDHEVCRIRELFPRFDAKNFFRHLLVDVLPTVLLLTAMAFGMAAFSYHLMFDKVFAAGPAAVERSF